MLPLYKLLSLFLRVFSRPLINLTKRYHANNQIKSDWIRRQFFKFGTWFHTLQTRINRRYLRTDASKITVKPLSEANAIDKGIEFFYEMLFYSIAIGFPMYEIYRQVVDSKAKDKKMATRIEKIAEKISKIKEEGQRLRTTLQQSEWEARHLSYEISTNYFLFCYCPVNEQLQTSAQILKKHASWMPQYKKQSKNRYFQLLI